jgi:predicted  nucleic acid-binding Zn-ribbon protein
MKQLELQNKTHRHHMNSKNIKIKELQLEIKRLNNEVQNLEPHLGKLNNKNSTARQIFSKGITASSITITPR